MILILIVVRGDGCIPDWMCMTDDIMTTSEVVGWMFGCVNEIDEVHNISGWRLILE